MPVIRLDRFSGKRPRIDEKIIAPHEATISINSRLIDGKLTPYSSMLEFPAITTIQDGPGSTLFRMYDDVADYWLGWSGDVDVARSPLIGDDTFRIAFTSDDFEPRQTDLALAAAGASYPDAWYKLGVTKPENAPTVGTTTGTATESETRIYVYTMVTQWGEESQASAASDPAADLTDSTWNLTALDVAPPNSMTVSAGSWAAGIATITLDSTFGLRVGDHVDIAAMNPAGYDESDAKITAISGDDISYAVAVDPTAYIGAGTVDRLSPHNLTGMVKRIYRSVTTSTSVVGFFFVGEIDIATTTFDDTPAIVIGEQLVTDSWEEPPTDMRGAVVHPSGSLVGFSGNTVYMSEPLAMYAFPTEFHFTTNYPIVGINITGSAVVVITEGYPYVIDGTTPAYMTIDRVDFPWNGNSKRGIVSSELGVIWPCNMGLASYGINGPNLLTREHYTQKTWSQTFNERFISSFTDDKYWGHYTDDEGVDHMFVFDTAEKAVSQIDTPLDTVYVDAQSNFLYGSKDGRLYQWDAHLLTLLDQTWQSKVFDFNRSLSMSVVEVEGEFGRNRVEEIQYQILVAAQTALNQLLMDDLPAPPDPIKGSLNSYSIAKRGFNGSLIRRSADAGGGDTKQVTVTVYIDMGDLLFSKSVSSETPFRLPSGILYDEVKIRVTGAVQIDSVAVATSVLELRVDNG